LHISKRLENEVIAGGKEIVLVVDEAHLLERQALEELRMLTNSEMDRRSLVSIIFVGQIWLRDRLRYREYEALNQRLRLRYALEGLTEKETGQYIQHHLELVGCSKELFTSDAVKQIFLASGGLLRPINNVCFASLLKAKSGGKKTVDGALVKRVAQEQEVL
jgi:type II secretory pathway predicted ATPase ExeA